MKRCACLRHLLPLEPGTLAGFVVLSDDLFAIAPAAIKDVQVERTVVDGKERYTME